MRCNYSLIVYSWQVRNHHAECDAAIQQAANDHNDLLSNEATRTLRSNKRTSQTGQSNQHTNNQSTAASINKHKSMTNGYKALAIQDSTKKTSESNSYSSGNSNDPVMVYVRGLIEGGLLSVAQASKRRAVTAYSGQIQVLI
jgi:hypothetical protein